LRRSLPQRDGVHPLLREAIRAAGRVSAKVTPLRNAAKARVTRARAELARFLSGEACAALDEYLAAVMAAASTAEPTRRWLTIDEGASEFGCSPATFRKRIDRGLLTKHRQGGRIYLDRRELDARLEESG
jgi:helix-turn-helix protein